VSDYHSLKQLKGDWKFNQFPC